MNENKSNLFENKSLFLSHVNEILSANNIDLTVQEPHNVTAGRGYSKTLVNIDICKKGQWVVVFTYDMSNYSLVRKNTLGKYNKSTTENIISEAYVVCEAILNGFHELDGTNKIKRQEDEAKANKQEYINDMTAELANEILYDESIYTNHTVKSFYSDFITRHNITCEDTKEIIFSRINRRFKRYAKENIPAETTDSKQNNQTNEQKEEKTTSYTVGNRSFTSLDSAYQYCIESDFDPEIMIIEEVATQQPSQTNTVTQTNKPAEPVKYYFYKQVFNNYMDAYNHALSNMSPVTMILPSNHPYMTNERLQQLEYSYTFEKSKMPYTDMKEYFQYISSLKLSADQQERYYKLKSYIDRYEYSQRSKQAEKDRLNDLMKESCIMLHFMKSKGLTINSSHDSGISFTKYIYNNQTIDSYITSAGIAIEKYHAMIKSMLEKHFFSYLNEYNNMTIYLYSGYYSHLEDMKTIQGFIYNDNTADTTLYAFDTPLNDTQVRYYSLVPCGQNTALQAV